MSSKQLGPIPVDHGGKMSSEIVWGCAKSLYCHTNLELVVISGTMEFGVEHLYSICENSSTYSIFDMQNGSMLNS